MATTMQVPELVRQKLAAFERIQAEFEKSFRFKEAVHGQKRFSSLSIADVVYYLHSLWLCECKDRLLGIFKNIRRYEGHRCLELLRIWQDGKNAEVVDFLTYKLDMLPLADITAQIETARHQQGDETTAHRLEHGRMILLNRGINLMHALEAIFSLAESDLLVEVREACKRYNHTPDQIETQLAELSTPLYSYQSHKLLAQQNMILMNTLTIGASTQPTASPEQHSEHVPPTREPLTPFAEHIINGYYPLLAPSYNNLRRVRFTDRVGFDREAQI